MRFLLVALLSTGLAVADTIYAPFNLVSDVPGLAPITDPNLKNPWGVSFSPTSPFWVSDAGTNKATLYSATGVPNSLVVATPGIGPTGQVFNTTTGFTLTPNNPARFIFANLDGTISGWNPAVNATNAVAKVLASPNNVYTGLAVASNGTSDFLYAANFKSGHIDVYDTNFALTTLAGNFTDPNLPSGYAPFNIENIGGRLYVEYAKVDTATGEEEAGPGNGFVSVFNADGSFFKREITMGQLNAPWGITMAPSSFGDFSNALLVGNFGDGHINAFDLGTGSFLGALKDNLGNPLAIDGLWALKVRAPGSGFDSNAVYFTAGIDDEDHGLFGKVAAVPEPRLMSMLAMGIAAIIARVRRRLVS